MVIPLSANPLPSSRATTDAFAPKPRKGGHVQSRLAGGGDGQTSQQFGSRQPMEQMPQASRAAAPSVHAAPAPPTHRRQDASERRTPDAGLLLLSLPGSGASRVPLGKAWAQIVCVCFGPKPVALGMHP